MQPFRHGSFPDQSNGAYFERGWQDFPGQRRLLSPRYPDECSVSNGYDRPVSAMAVAEAVAHDARTSSWVKSSPRVPPPFRMDYRVPHLETPARFARYGYDYRAPPMNREMRPVYRLPSDLKRLVSMGCEPDRPIFVSQLISLCEENQVNVSALPVVSKQVIDLYALYKAVRDFGGSLEVSRNKRWKEVALLLTGNNSSSTCYGVKRNYVKFILPYECKYDLDNADPLLLQQQLEPKRDTPSRLGEDDDLSGLASPSTVCSDARFVDARPSRLPTPLLRRLPDSRQIMLSLMSDLPMHVLAALLQLGRITTLSSALGPDLSRMLIITYNGALFDVLLKQWRSCFEHSSPDDSLSRAVSRVLRNISFIPANQSAMANSDAMVSILLRVLGSREVDSLPQASLVEDALVTLSNIALHLPSQSASSFAHPLLFWVTTDSSLVRSSLLPDSPQALTPLRLSTECLLNLAANKKTRDQLLVCLSPHEFCSLFPVLAHELYTKDIVIRELNASLLCLLFNGLARTRQDVRELVLEQCFRDLLSSVVYFLDCCHNQAVEMMAHGESFFCEFLALQAVQVLACLAEWDRDQGHIKSVLSARVAPLLLTERFPADVRTRLEYLLFRAL